VAVFPAGPSVLVPKRIGRRMGGGCVAGQCGVFFLGDALFREGFFGWHLSARAHLRSAERACARNAVRARNVIVLGLGPRAGVHLLCPEAFTGVDITFQHFPAPSPEGRKNPNLSLSPPRHDIEPRASRSPLFPVRALSCKERLLNGVFCPFQGTRRHKKHHELPPCPSRHQRVVLGHGLRARPRLPPARGRQERAPQRRLRPSVSGPQLVRPPSALPHPAGPTPRLDRLALSLCRRMATERRLALDQLNTRRFSFSPSQVSDSLSPARSPRSAPRRALRPAHPLVAPERGIPVASRRSPATGSRRGTSFGAGPSASSP